MLRVNREAATDFLALLSLANLSFLAVWRELLYASGADAYYLPQYFVLQYLLPVLVVLTVAAVLFLLLVFARRSRTLLGRYLLFGLFLIGCAILTVNLLAWIRIALVPVPPWKILPYLNDSPALTAGLAAVSLFFAFVLVKGRHLVVPTLKMLFLAFSPFVLITFSQLAVSAVQAEGGPSPVSPQRLAEARTSGSVPAGAGNKVIWIIFDELDRRVLFEDSPPGFAIPSFRRLFRTALVASRVAAPGEVTLRAIPALLTGRPIVEAKPASAEDLLIKLEGNNGFQRFDPDRSLFAVLAREGYRNVIAGYYHPYCRLFKGLYDACRRYPDLDQDSGSVVQVLKSYVTVFPRFRYLHSIDRLRKYRDFVYAQATRPDVDLLYVHAPIPHRPIIYDAGSGSFTIFNFSLAGYFDNVALVDRFFGGLRRELEAAGQWDNTHLVIMADHGWMLSEAYDGTRWEGIPYIVKLAGQAVPVVYDGPFDPLATGELVRSLLRGEIADPAALRTWMSQHELALSRD